MIETVENAVKRIALAVLPAPILYRLWHLRRRKRPRTTDSNAMDGRQVPVCDGAFLEIYWTEAPLGSGPCVSMFVLEEEVMRIDCLGGTAGHMHLNPVQQSLLVGWRTTPRLFFPPSDRDSQIERAVFELTSNTLLALHTNQLARIRNFTIEDSALETAAEKMRAAMNDLVHHHEAQSGGAPAAQPV